MGKLVVESHLKVKKEIQKRKVKDTKRRKNDIQLSEELPGGGKPLVDGRSNWEKLQSRLKSWQRDRSKRPPKSNGALLRGAAALPSLPAAKTADDLPNVLEPIGDSKEITKQIAVDCEMVGTGVNGSKSMLGRVSLVNYHGQVLYDKHIIPPDKVTDYRTKYSGIRKYDLYAKNGAIPLRKAQDTVATMLKGSILIGHAINNDLEVLLLKHPRNDIRDTAHYKPLRPDGGNRTPSLKKLSEQVLGVRIQEGEHDSAIDARAAMYLYRKHEVQWEASLSTKRKRAPSKEQMREVKRRRVELRRMVMEEEAEKAVGLDFGPDEGDDETDDGHNAGGGVDSDDDNNDGGRSSTNEKSRSTAVSGKKHQFNKKGFSGEKRNRPGPEGGHKKGNGSHLTKNKKLGGGSGPAGERNRNVVQGKHVFERKAQGSGQGGTHKKAPGQGGSEKSHHKQEKRVGKEFKKGETKKTGDTNHKNPGDRQKKKHKKLDQSWTGQKIN